ncbi:MAG: helix-turn-helix domain-containing protein [Nitrosomonas sp. PRO4]|nr:helix-turn-helix domain-containing protein [Nitrosomonas sp. PRO4]
MNNINQTSDSNDQFSGDTAERIDLNTAINNYSLQKEEHDTARKHTRNDSTMDQNAALSSDENTVSSSVEQNNGSGEIPVDQNQPNEHTAGNDREMAYANPDSIYVSHGLNDINASSVVQGVGHLLRKARLAKGLSVDDVSRQLRLSVQQVEAIETEDFDKLSGRTFLRGFVRNYANLMQLNSAPLLQMLPEPIAIQSTYERTPLRNKQLSFSSNRTSTGNNRLVIIIVLFAAILGAYFLSDKGYWNTGSGESSSRPSNLAGDKASVEIQLPLSSTEKTIPNIPSDKATEINAPIIFEKSQIGAETKTETLAIPIENKVDNSNLEESSSVLSRDMGSLYFKFTADSWVKIVDGNHVTILEQIRKGGSEQVITGKKPFSIVLGNVAGVNLTYNDTEIDLSSYKKQDGTARFTLE